MTRDGLAAASDLARASVPLASISLLWCALVWDSPTYLALTPLGVVASCAAVRPDVSPGPDQGISPLDAGGSLPASSGPSNP